MKVSEFPRHVVEEDELLLGVVPVPRRSGRASVVEVLLRVVADPDDGDGLHRLDRRELLLVEATHCLEVVLETIDEPRVLRVVEDQVVRRIEGLPASCEPLAPLDPELGIEILRMALVVLAELLDVDRLDIDRDQRTRRLVEVLVSLLEVGRRRKAQQRDVTILELVQPGRGRAHALLFDVDLRRRLALRRSAQPSRQKSDPVFLPAPLAIVLLFLRVHAPGAQPLLQQLLEGERGKLLGLQLLVAADAARRRRLLLLRLAFALPLPFVFGLLRPGVLRLGRIQRDLDRRRLLARLRNRDDPHLVIASGTRPPGALLARRGAHELPDENLVVRLHRDLFVGARAEELVAELGLLDAIEAVRDPLPEGGAGHEKDREARPERSAPDSGGRGKS